MVQLMQLQVKSQRPDCQIVVLSFLSSTNMLAYPELPVQFHSEHCISVSFAHAKVHVGIIATVRNCWSVLVTSQTFRSYPHILPDLWNMLDISVCIGYWIFDLWTSFSYINSVIWSYCPGCSPILVASFLQVQFFKIIVHLCLSLLLLCSHPFLDKSCRLIFILLQPNGQSVWRNGSATHRRLMGRR